MTTWKRISLVACVSLLAAPRPGLADDKILSFDTMTGVVRPFTGAANPIRGVPGGGIPWTLTAPIVFVTSPPSPTNPTGSWFAATGF
jgi:hypothetical protein